MKTDATQLENFGGIVLNKGWETPFESIEGAQKYMCLLAEAVDEARQEVEADISAKAGPDDRRVQALRIVSYKLEKLAQHMKHSQRILNDLRSLRRLLFEERRQQLPPAELDLPENVSELEQCW